MMESTSKKRIIVGLSGGVDSSTTAAILKKEGWDVIGVMLKLYEEEPRNNATKCNIGCCGIRGVEDARAVSRQLDIPLYVLNYQKIFRETVINNFIDEYRAGRTPNPCVVCNEQVKFGKLLREAAAMGIDCIATGHYARIEYDSVSKRFLLYRGNDPYKDQTYFLWVLNQSQLRRTKFPLGKMRKTEVRHLAKEMGIRVHSKPGSKEICFVPDNDYRNFLKKNVREPEHKGHIVDIDGKVLGTHSGISRFTVGQRRGLGVSASRPLYVVRIDPEKNEVVVGEQSVVWNRGVEVDHLNLISCEKIESPMEAEVKVRYNMKPVKSVLYPNERPDTIRVEFAEPVRAATPGQSAVFYQGDLVVGGAVIRSSIPLEKTSAC